MAVAVASVVPFPCSDSPAEYRAPLALPLFPAPPVRVRRDSGVMVAPAAFSVHRMHGVSSKEMNAMSKTGHDESTKEDILPQDAEPQPASIIVSRKRSTRDDEDEDEQDVREERETKKRRVASGITLVDLKINVVVPPIEPKTAPIVEFEPTAVDDAETAEFDRQIEEIEKQIAEAMQKLESAESHTSSRSAPPACSVSPSSPPVVSGGNRPVRPSPLKAFAVTKPHVQLSKMASVESPVARLSSPPPSLIVPPSLPSPAVDRQANGGKSTRGGANSSAPLRRSRRLSSLPPLTTKVRRVSPPPRDSLYRQVLINQMRIASMADDFGSPSFSPPTPTTSLPSTNDDDVDMERVDTHANTVTPTPEPIDPRLFPRQGCLKQMKAEHERRRMEKEFDCELAWFAAKLQWEMMNKKTGNNRRDRGS
ncbi:hypothetical protein DACRYDRAFT_20288 [Dacryopinax primogenitus]|uniref:Uncharacterized protein n=1 Tax=Dacryopinax primogenitus (strain DJM 731) TaxID=1858805 RepID=M5GFZ2_DACPD|nr:uncharacterized protein DACRYDRAFT_20288 [Dacryopinax primogenitus]EJU04583.1 hypothetical protein DACRYDRAFT_20288 [Dacryopinax primogenitus]